MKALSAERDPFPSPPAAPAATLRIDGLVNPFLGYGTSRDKVAGGHYGLVVPLTDFELHALYYGSDVGATIVDRKPNDMLRREYTLTGARAEELRERAEDLELDAKVLEAMTMARLWGGSLLVLGALDGAENLSLPLEGGRIREVKYLHVVDRRYANVLTYQGQALKPNFGEPELYVIGGHDVAPATIHASRVIRFDGVKADRITMRARGGWGYSSLQRPYETIRAFDTGFSSASQLLSDASQAVWKIQDLIESLASNREAFEARMAISDMARSAGRGVVVDAENEDFTRITTSFAGIPDTLDRFMMRLSAAAEGLPVTLLMGRSPAGQNATGDSDFRGWYDVCANAQKKDLRPKLRRAYEVLAGGELPKDFDLCFPPLWEPSDTEKATVAKLKADTHKVYVDLGVYMPEQVAIAEFGSGEGKIEIDEARVKQALAQEVELALENPRGAQPPPGQQPVDEDGNPVPPGAPGAAPVAAAKPGEEPTDSDEEDDDAPPEESSKKQG